MVRRRSLAVIGALSAVIALQTAPVATAQVVDRGPSGIVTELPQLSELPPLPSAGAPVEEEPVPEDTLDMSAVQAVALVLAIGALVAGGTGLALVTRRGRGEPPEGPSGRAETVARHAR